MAMKPLIHIVDDDAAFRDSMQVLLTSMDMEVACYATAQKFLEAPRTVQPGCVLLDLRMPGMSGLELQRELRDWQLSLPVVFLSGHADIQTSVSAMHQGAADFLTKPVREEVLLEKLHDMIEISKQRRSENNQHMTLCARVELLSPRERQVLEGVYNGQSNKEIARNLDISYKTVELHRSNMMAKMRADSLADLVRMRVQLDEAKAAPE